MRRALLLSLCVLMFAPALASATISQGVWDASAPAPAPGVATATPQVFTSSGPDLDCIRMRWLSGPAFDAPNVVTDFSDASWSQSWGYPYDAAFGGDPVPSISYVVNWASDFADGTSFINAFYGNNVYLGGFISTYTDNAGWEFVFTDDWDPGKENPTPEPATWMAMLAGLGVLGYLRFRS